MATKRRGPGRPGDRATRKTDRSSKGGGGEIPTRLTYAAERERGLGGKPKRKRNARAVDWARDAVFDDKGLGLHVPMSEDERELHTARGKWRAEKWLSFRTFAEKWTEAARNHGRGDMDFVLAEANMAWELAYKMTPAVRYDHYDTYEGPAFRDFRSARPDLIGKVTVARAWERRMVERSRQAKTEAERRRQQDPDRDERGVLIPELVRLHSARGAWRIRTNPDFAAVTKKIAKHLKSAPTDDLVWLAEANYNWEKKHGLTPSKRWDEYDGTGEADFAQFKSDIPSGEIVTVTSAALAWEDVMADRYHAARSSALLGPVVVHGSPGSAKSTAWDVPECAANRPGTESFPTPTEEDKKRFGETWAKAFEAGKKDMEAFFTSDDAVDPWFVKIWNKHRPKGIIKGEGDMLREMWRDRAKHDKEKHAWSWLDDVFTEWALLKPELKQDATKTKSAIILEKAEASGMPVEKRVAGGATSSAPAVSKDELKEIGRDLGLTLAEISLALTRLEMAIELKRTQDWTSFVTYWTNCALALGRGRGGDRLSTYRAEGFMQWELSVARTASRRYAEYFKLDPEFGKFSWAWHKQNPCVPGETGEGLCAEAWERLHEGYRADRRPWADVRADMLKRVDNMRAQLGYEEGPPVHEVKKTLDWASIDARRNADKAFKSCLDQIAAVIAMRDNEELRHAVHLAVFNMAVAMDERCAEAVKRAQKDELSSAVPREDRSKWVLGHILAQLEGGNIVRAALACKERLAEIEQEEG